MKREVVLPAFPTRIVSLVPSQTELLYHLGLEDRVVGITKFCVHPNIWYKTKIRTGGTKQTKLEVVKSLNPDLIIGNKEENEQSQIEELSEHFPVWMSDIFSLEDALHMIQSIGEITNKEAAAKNIVQNIEQSFSQLVPIAQTKSVLYLIWRNPYMAAGKNTFINEMLSSCGLKNCLPNSSRYPTLTKDQIIDLNPELILLSSEPYPFKEKHIEELQSILPNARILLVDGEYFSWYGSRLTNAPKYFQEIIDAM